jgi:glycosyltransferase involved in cell wall biosynthesis
MVPVSGSGVPDSPTHLVDGRGSFGSTRRLLIVAWEYPGVNSQQGSALARRVGQLARGFARHGWRVDVLHNAHDREPPSPAESSGLVSLYAVRAANTGTPHHRARLTRRLTTAWYAARYGDRSEQWARIARRKLGEFDGRPPSVVIGCFTPRGPLSVARTAAERWHVPWIADLQDPALEGASRHLQPLVAGWMRRTLRSAFAVVQVAPEWARTDSLVLERPVMTLRHAVPAVARMLKVSSRSSADRFVLLYSGSIIKGHQSPDPLMQALARLNEHTGRSIVLEVAGAEGTIEAFRECLPRKGANAWFRPLGWLGTEELSAAMQRAHCLVLVPSREAGRPVVPSKLYEYMAFDRPVLVAGSDGGGLDSLYEEWGHPNVTCTSADSIALALDAARSGDASMLLRRADCTHPPMEESQLIDRYVSLAEQAVAVTKSVG